MNKAIKKLLFADQDNPDRFFEGLEKALSEMEAELRAVCECRDRELSENLERIITSGGKRLRPVLVYLGYMAGKEDPERLF